MNDVLRIKDLINSDSYIIPVYQRDFAWGAHELERLVRDIENARCASVDRYYIGTIVTFLRDGYFEVVDGQQRLTALSILLALSDDTEHIDLHYEARAKSEYALSRLREHNPEIGVHHSFYSSSRLFAEFIKDLDKPLFFSYLKDHVYILRLDLAESVDLNHYFEIMNSRHKQSEECDVLLSQLLSLSSDEKEHELIRIIWNGLSRFDQYIQQGIPKRLWNRLFYGDGVAPLLDSDPEEWWKTVKGHVEGDGDDFIGSIDSALLFDSEEHIRAEVMEDNGIRHYSLINFPEFIIIASEIIYKERIVHDDKLFLSYFAPFKRITTSEDARYFINSLLKLRFLFDTYIVKLSNNEWSLARYIDANDFIQTFGSLNQELVAIESMYASALSEEWIENALSYLYEHPHLEGNDFMSYLEGLLPSFKGMKYELYKNAYLETGKPSIPYLVINDGRLVKA